MAVQRNKNLAKTLNGINIDGRFINWLWLYLKNLDQSLNLGEFGSLGMRDRIVEAIKNNDWIKQKIDTERGLYLTPKENLNWITSDKRQCHWVARKISERGGPRFTTEIANLTDRDLVIAAIDIWNIHLSEKTSNITAIALEWNSQKREDGIYDWFNGTDEEGKLKLALEIARKIYPALTISQEPIKQTSDLIALMDAPFFSTAEKKLFIESVKKRWSNNKYRANMKGKNQYNFILSDKAIGILDKLKDKHSLKRTQILEILLQMEDEKGIYIPEKIKILKGI